MTNPEQGEQVQAPTRPTGEAPLAGPTARPVNPVRPSRLGGLWILLTSGAVVLLLLLIFILENGREVEIAYFGVHGHLPLGVALLLAAIFGILLVVVPGGGRMLQLRMAARRQARRARSRPPQPAQPAPTDPSAP
ncbi:MAG TPA: lipopolysaccharide assembly protein LapA domain-containing protein [Actinocrinis sp.]|uniref:lipopolysaccharide assembly protein LapA domain-containing protein n=1 Tax=Actinocrinis sp. TaxID=1920516 RepID=UPI002D350B57|nr:lipopolysaccharide assembly protein LapA domain-containing protein [Actinocrinis sp.]HZU58741.1 lipopolysaccharide assembly protein LapA domain-containing protein [Actinocrinis sp.]